jgi:hypothetical protein
MTTNHTPGPWREILPKMSSAITIYGKDNRPVCATFGNGSETTLKMVRSGETVANARLIAAAPDLLAALEYALSLLEGYPDSATDPIRAAIARAKVQA